MNKDDIEQTVAEAMAAAREAMVTAREERDRETVAALLAEAPKLSTVTTEANYDLPSAVDITDLRENRVRVNTLRVRWNRVVEKRGPEDHEGWVEVHGYAHLLRADGALDQRHSTYWTPMPDALAHELAGELMLR